MEQQTAPEPVTGESHSSVWARIREHKVIEWGIGYLGAALALAHGAELVTHALHWPDAVWRSVVIALIVGFPIALTVSWYHGHKGLTRISAGELSIVSVLLLIGAVFFTAALRPSAEHGAAEATQPAEAAEHDAADTVDASARERPQPNSIAVLPFVNNSSEADQEHFVDGLSGELINALSRVRGLAVTGRTSSFAFKGRSESLRTIGDALGVAYVLEGSVQKAGSEIRIAAQLVDARTDRQLWSGAYPRTLDDIFAIQDEITREVAEALQITLGVGELGGIPGQTRDVAAYEEYVQATALYARFEPEPVQTAIEHLERAVALDPSFALGWIKLADVYSNAELVMADRMEEWRRDAANAAGRARQLTPESPFVAAWTASDNARNGRWLEAAKFYENLPTTFGANTDTWLQTGRFLMDAGRASDAIPYLERAKAADPLSGLVALYLGDAYASVGSLEKALAELDRGEPLGQFDDFIRGSASIATLAMRDRATIDRYLVPFRSADARQYAGPPRDVHIAMMRFLDNPTGAPAEIRSLAETGWVVQDPVALEVLAAWAGYFGEPELELDVTRRAVASGGGTIRPYLLWRRIHTDMRKLPGFKEIVRELGLVDYWRAYGWSDFCRPTGENDFECV